MSYKAYEEFGDSFYNTKWQFNSFAIDLWEETSCTISKIVKFNYTVYGWRAVLIDLHCVYKIQCVYDAKRLQIGHIQRYWTQCKYTLWIQVLLELE